MISMSGYDWEGLLSVMTVACLVGLCLAGLGAAAGMPADDGPVKSPPEQNASKHPNIASSVLSSSEPTVAQHQSNDGTRVVVVVEATAGNTGAAKRRLTQRGDIHSQHKDLFEVSIPRSELKAVANSSNIEYIRAPVQLDQSGTTSEGVSTIEADTAHLGGYTGNSTRVAVIDSGFDTSNPEIAHNIVATKDFTGDGITTGQTEHGTATAEIVVDTAPDAELVLISVDNTVDFLNAVQYIDSNGIDVASASIGFPGFYSGNGDSRVSQAVDDSVAQGTAWTIASGNEADGAHWNGTWSDPDGDGWLNFNGQDETLKIDGPVDARLRWDDFPGSANDYDLYLVNSSGNVVARSTTLQDGSQPPRERIVYASGDYALAIYRDDAAGTADFDLFSVGSRSQLEYSTAARSVIAPATADRAFSIGAVYHDTGQLEPFSSRGPTVDGRQKPEFVAPDGVSTTAKSGSFFGTSAAAPHAAGVVALVSSGFPTYGVSDIQQRLEATSTPVTGTEPNNLSGYGLLDAREAVPPLPPAAIEHSTGTINRSQASATDITTVFPGAPTGGTVDLRITDAKQQAAVYTQAVNSSANRTTHTGVDLSTLTDGSLTVAARLQSPSGVSNRGGYIQLATLEKDTSRPSVTEYNVSTPAPGVISVRVNASESLAAGTLRSSGPQNESFTLTDFQQTDTTYLLNYSVARAGNYSLTLNDLRDDVGNRGGSETVNLHVSTAMVHLENQTGTKRVGTVTVDRFSTAAGGYVTIHDATLVSEGAIFDSIRGTSPYYGPGEARDVTVSLDRPIEANESGAMFYAMAHRDTDGDRVFDFATSEGAEDGPYTNDDGDVVVDPATIGVERVATVRFDDQQTNGSTIEVASTTLPSGGFVTIHDDTVASAPFESVRGASAYLQSGTTRNVTIDLEDPATANGTFYAMPHRDTDGDGVYDFIVTNGSADGPYLDENGSIVLDGGKLQVTNSGGAGSLAVSLTASNTTTAPGENATLRFNLTNNGTTSSGFVLNVTDLPANVSIVDQFSDGATWSQNRTAWIWQGINASERVQPNVTLALPESRTDSFTLTGAAKTSDGAVTDQEVTVHVCQSVAEAIDQDGNGRIGDFEILNAINHWRSQTVVPGTCGMTIDDLEILQLIETWREGSQV